MKIEALENRVHGTRKKIEKVNGTLERHKSRLEKIKKSINEYGVDLENYNKYDYRNNDDLWELLYDYEYKLDDVKNNEKKLKELYKDLEKYTNLLEVERKKKDDINNLIPDCLKQFLEQWKNKCKEYYTDLANRLIEVSFKEYEVTKEELQKLYVTKTDFKTREKKIIRRYEDSELDNIIEDSYLNDIASYQIRQRYIEDFREKYFTTDLMVIDKIIDYNTINFEALEKILNNEVEAKKEMFIERIKEVVGVIEDLTDLSIGDNGEINGIVIGKKCKARVQTIGAGGYNIQCYHFRVLVNKIK